MAEAWEPHYPTIERVDQKRCRASVWRSGAWRPEQCGRPASTEPDARGLRWCSVHSPEGEQRRKERVHEEQVRANRGRDYEARAALRQRELARWAETDALPWLADVLVPELARLGATALALAARDLIERGRSGV